MVCLKNCKWSELKSRIQNKNVYCYGSGNLLTWISCEVSGVLYAEQIKGIIDNDSAKAGTLVHLDGYQIPIITFKNFLQKYERNTVVIITSSYYSEMLEQLDKESLLQGMECYIEVFLEEEKIRMVPCSSSEYHIPKKLHYCWFGNQPLPLEYENYISTWRKYCPKYEIIRWDESNYDYRKHAYMRQAYEAGKYAFVSDYARLDIVYREGGVYLDTDVEMVKSFDALLNCKMFLGFEQGHLINTGLGFGAVKGLDILGEMRDRYNQIKFIKSDGTINNTPCPYYQTQFLQDYGLKRNGKFQRIQEINILPRTYLAPLDYYGVYSDSTENTFAIHHYSATWKGCSQNRKSWLEKNRGVWERIYNE